MVCIALSGTSLLSSWLFYASLITCSNLGGEWGRVVAQRMAENMGDSGDLLFDVAFDKLLKTDIIPSEMKESLPKRITDRKRLGFTLAKKEGQKSYEILQKLGLS